MVMHPSNFIGLTGRRDGGERLVIFLSKMEANVDENEPTESFLQELWHRP